MRYFRRKQYRDEISKRRASRMKIISEEKWQQRRRAAEEQQAKMMTEIENMNLEELVTAFYEVKGELRGFGRSAPTAAPKQIATDRKDAILLALQQTLRKAPKRKAEKVRAKLWEDLGVVV